MTDAADRVLASCSRGEREELRVTLREYKGHPFVDVRVWYRDRDGGNLLPGKGCTVKRRELGQVASALDAAIHELEGTAEHDPSENW